MRDHHVRLRTRIVIRIGLLVAGLAVALGVSTYYLVQGALLDDHERTTAEQFRTNATALTAGLENPELDETALLASLRPELAARDLLLSDGVWTTASTTVSPSDLPEDLIGTVTDGRPADDQVSIRGDDYTVYGAPLTPQDFYFEVFSLAEVDNTLATLRTTLVAVGSVATLVGMAVAAWISSGVARPLERVSAAAADLADGDLRARLADHDTAEIAGISASFNRMADALAERIDRESRFAADVSHELRSPLTTLANAVAVLESRRGDLSPEADEALTLLAGDVTRFERLVTDLIEISKHDAGSMRLDLEDLPVSTAITVAARRAGGERVPITVAPDAEHAVVRVDRQRLDRIIGNLLENAEAYGAGAIGIAVEAGAESVHVAVDDAGPGVDPGERERIFERFSRGSHGERRTTADGSGLGLALARENAVLLGGSMAVTDSDAGGARFVLTLPRIG